MIQENEAPKPTLPWPIEGKQDIEIARWSYPPNRKRSGGHWIYVIRLLVTDSVLHLRALRFRESHVNQHRFEYAPVCYGPELPIDVRERKPPTIVVEAFQEFAALVYNRSKNDQANSHRHWKSQTTFMREEGLMRMVLTVQEGKSLTSRGCPSRSRRRK
jgi:hypothetical protein